MRGALDWNCSWGEYGEWEWDSTDDSVVGGPGFASISPHVRIEEPRPVECSGEGGDVSPGFG